MEQSRVSEAMIIFKRIAYYNKRTFDPTTELSSGNEKKSMEMKKIARNSISTELIQEDLSKLESKVNFNYLF
jgi:hypothetical protein